MQRIDLAKELIQEASDRLKDIYFKGNIKAINKDIDGNIVTYADKEIEDFLIAGIKKYFPDDIIIAEESGSDLLVETTGKDIFIWAIDPIDGTRNFASGIPFFAISIGVMQNNSLQFGIISEPAQRNVFYAERDKGAFKNNIPINVIVVDKIEDKLILLGFSGKDNRIKAGKILGNLVRTRVLGSAALNLCFVAQGQAIGSIVLGPHSWDVAAGIIIVEEAGGRVTDENGMLVNIFQKESLNIIATNGTVHDRIIKELKNI